MFSVIVAALTRKVSAFVAEVLKLVGEAEVEAKAIEAEAKAEAIKLRDELVAKIAAL